MSNMQFMFSKNFHFKFTCVFVFFNYFCNSNCERDFFVAKKYGKDKYLCVTNTSFALAWIDDNEDSLKSVSEHIPSQPKSDFDFEVGDEDNTKLRNSYLKSPWLLKKSLEWSINEVILDRRWEELPIIKTKYRLNSLHHEVIPLHLPNSNNFEIPLSIRAQNEANVFFSDDSFSGYSFKLEGLSEKISLKRCEHLDMDQTRVPCNPVPSSTQTYPVYLSDKYWSHFKITKKGNDFTFTQIDNHKTRRHLMEVTDTDDKPVNITQLIIYSDSTNAFWKIHQIQYLYTNIKQKNVNLGPRLKPIKGSICISMFIVMCECCHLQLKLKRQTDIVEDQTFARTRKTSILEWIEIKFLAENVEEDEYQLLVSTSTFFKCTPFWAIDKVRRCQKKEFRSIHSDKRADCQLIANQHNTISFDTKSITNFEYDCPENTIGEFCVPCKWIFEDCKQIGICTKDAASKPKCFCSAGYRNYDCNLECERGFYGHGCWKKCETCSDDCGIYSSSCSRCSDDYKGAKCDIQRTTRFAKAPQIINTTYATATIQMTDFTLENVTDDDLPDTYSLQYKKADDSERSWKYFGGSYKFHEAVSFKISNLEADNYYFVRGVITKNDFAYINPYIQFARFKTTCRETTEIFEVRPTNESVSLYLNTTNNTCKPFKSFAASIQGVGEGTASRDNAYLVWNNLTPFKNYTIIIRSNNNEAYNLSFQTTEGIPDPVRNLIISGTSTSCTLEWNKPLSIYGTLKHYVVQYQLQSYSACKNTLHDFLPVQSITTNNISVQIGSLLPYSSYKFAVFAVNNKFNGLKQYKRLKTLPLSKIQLDEIPKIQYINTDADNDRKVCRTKIELSQLNCTKLRGPLFANVTLNCFTTWCQNRTTSLDLEKDYYILEDLSPFTDYKLELKFCRNQTVCSNLVETKSFKTDPTDPHRVKDLLIFSKDETTISVRWRPPFPPTGILGDYHVDYYYYWFFIWIKSKKSISTTNDPCKLWPEFQCLKLSNLQKNEKYTIEVYARNIKGNLGEPTSIHAVTSVEQSEAPYDLHITWKNENTLKLEWKHPNQSNGDIKLFRIRVTSTTSKKVIIIETLSIDKYELTYNYEINGENLLPSTYYTFSIAAFNGLSGKVVAVADTSPPDTPSLRDFQVSSTNETIIVNVSTKEPRGTQDYYSLVVLVSDNNDTPVIIPQLENINLKKLRIVTICNITDFSITHSIIIGDSNQLGNCEERDNPRLNPGTEYNITIVLISAFQGKITHKVSSLYKTTEGKPTTDSNKDTVPTEPTDSSNLWPLLLLLLLIPIAAFLFIKRRRLAAVTNNLLSHHNSSNNTLDIYENESPSMDFEDSVIVPSPEAKVHFKRSKSPKKHQYSKPIKVDEFEDYVKECLQNGEFERQHSLFPHGQTKPWTYGSKNENKPKNRYNNLVAYDHSRVILSKTNGDPCSDYINASYIDGYQIPKAYIATQGPKASTLDDFWRMIWQENVKFIVMLANVYEGGKKNVEKYWPMPNEVLKFDDITVKHVSNRAFADFEHRTFSVTRHEETRKVDQLHFLSWPDHGVPLYTQNLVPFLQQMLKVPLTTKSPLVVHCSAGVGRTGTVLLCHITLKMAAKEGTVDLLKNLQRLRDQRANLVDNAEQYKLAHLVVLETLTGVNTCIPCSALDETVKTLLENKGMYLQLEYLKAIQWRDEALKVIGQKGKADSIVAEKNRFQEIVPEIQGRVCIDSDSYINAVYVDGFRNPQRYIVTQQPLPNTLDDFWTLIDENHVSTIISLNEIDPDDETVCNFYPASNRQHVKPSEDVTIKHVKTLSLKFYDLITVQMDSVTKADRLVEILVMKNWPAGANCPNAAQFLAFWEDSHAAFDKSKKVVVTCYDGARASGLYVAISLIIEKIQLEQLCDVCQAVRTVRHNRSQFVQEEEQFAFLYRAAVDYINGFQSYADFI